MHDLYDDFAKVYDECGVDDYSLSFGKGMLKYLDLIHPDESFKKNLDICCGTGTLCGFFKDNGIKTKGVDISNEMIKVAQSKYPDIEFVTCDVSKYSDYETYDFITCSDDALQHITNIYDIKKTIKNVNKLLRPNGLFILDLNNFNLISFEKRNKSLDETRRLVYQLHRENELVCYNVKYYENDELLLENNVFELDISVDELTQMLNDEGFILESCSQHFFFEKQIKKWKLVYKKTDD